MPPDDVASLEARDCSNENPTIAHDEVVAFDQQESKIASEVGLLIIGGAQGTRTENSYARLRPLAGGLQSSAERTKKRRQPFDIEV